MFNIQTFGHSASRWLAKILNSLPDVWCVHMGRQAGMTLGEYIALIQSQSLIYKYVGTIGAISPDEFNLLPKDTKTIWLERHPIDRINSAIALNPTELKTNLPLICYLLTKNILSADPKLIFKMEEITTYHNEIDRLLQYLDINVLPSIIYGLDLTPSLKDSWNTQQLNYCSQMSRKIHHMIPSEVWDKYKALDYKIDPIYTEGD